MSFPEKDFFAELHGIAERGKVSSVGDFEKLSHLCGARGTAREAWDHAQKCRRNAWAALIRHRDNIRRQGRWNAGGEALQLALLVLLGIVKGYAAAALRYLHLVDVLDLSTAQRALDRLEQLAA